jgi:transposase
MPTASFDRTAHPRLTIVCQVKSKFLHLNPIEQAFSKLKAALRKGATRAVDALFKLIRKLVKSFAPKTCANYFRHAGYAK